MWAASLRSLGAGLGGGAAHLIIGWPAPPIGRALWRREHAMSPRAVLQLELYMIVYVA